MLLAVAVVAAYTLDFFLHGKQAWWHLVFLVVLSSISPGWQFGVDLDKFESEGRRQYLKLTGHDDAEIARQLASTDRLQMRMKLGTVCVGEAAALLLYGRFTLLPSLAMWFLLGCGALMLGVTVFSIVAAIRGKV